MLTTRPNDTRLSEKFWRLNTGFVFVVFSVFFCTFYRFVCVRPRRTSDFVFFCCALNKLIYLLTYLLADLLMVVFVLYYVLLRRTSV